MKRRRYFLIYTVLFLFASFAVFSWYFMKERTLIWQEDGQEQHYRALVYYAQYLRTIVRNLFLEHRLIIPSWDFSIGEGSDILTTLHYYVIGDPFTLLSVLVPERFMYIYYEAMVLLRMYLAGIAFSVLCFHTGKKSGCAVMAGAMSYVFCYWAIYTAARHPYFLNPMIYFPMLILGVEKILKKERPYLFIVTVFFSAVSNFYFFYMLVLATVIYVAVRLLRDYRRDMRLASLQLLKIGGASILGVLLAAVIFLPVCGSVLGDARISSGNSLHLFYPLSYYSELPSLFIMQGGDYWLCLGFAVPVLPAVFLMLRRRKEHGLLKWFLAVCILITLVPALGQAFNGFSYMCNRWCWAFALLSAYILAEMWPELMRLNGKDTAFLFLCTAVYWLICKISDYSGESGVYPLIIITLDFLVVLIPKLLSSGRKQQLGMLILFIGVFYNSYLKNAPAQEDYAAETLTVSQVKELMRNETAAVHKAALEEGTDSFFRYSGEPLTRNAGMSAGLSSTQYYWTLTNPEIVQYRSEMELTENTAHIYTGFDGRAAMLALDSVLYYVISGEEPSAVPYGFTHADTVSLERASGEAVSYEVYRNAYALPFGYTYDSYMTEATWETLSAAERQEALLQAVLLEDEGSAAAFPEAALAFTGKDMDYTASCTGGEVSLQDDSFVVTAADSQVTFAFDGLPESETYFSIEGLTFEGTSAYDLYFGGEDVDPENRYSETEWNQLSAGKRKKLEQDKRYKAKPARTDITLEASSGVSKTLVYFTEDYSYYNNRHDFTVNLSYSEEGITSITVTFQKIGVYRFDSVSVYCQPMEGYAEYINALKRDSLENVEFGTDTVSGSISLETPKLLCLSVPYSEGWSAYVDGEETELFPANGMYMALPLTAGEHRLRLVYKTPLLKEGVCISAFSALIFMLLVILNERRLSRKGKALPAETGTAGSTQQEKEKA